MVSAVSGDSYLPRYIEYVSVLSKMGSDAVSNTKSKIVLYVNKHLRPLFSYPEEQCYLHEPSSCRYPSSGHYARTYTAPRAINISIFLFKPFNHSNKLDTVFTFYKVVHMISSINAD